MSRTAPFIDPKQFAKDVQINRAGTLDDAMHDQMGLFAYYAEQCALAQKHADNAKMKRDIIEAKIDQEVRDEAAEAGTKMTEKMIENAIKRDRRWIDIQMKLNEARAEADLAKSCLEAFRQRRDMLIQLGASAREELKGELRTMAREEAGKASELRQRDLRDRAAEIVKGR